MHIETKYNIMQKNKEKKFMEKNEIKGLTKKEVEEKIKLGNVNTTSKNNLKSNWQIVFDNVFTLFNLYNLIIAIALVCVKAYTNTFFFFIMFLPSFLFFMSFSPLYFL